MPVPLVHVEAVVESLQADSELLGRLCFVAALGFECGEDQPAFDFRKPGSDLHPQYTLECSAASGTLQPCCWIRFTSSVRLRGVVFALR